ncbi:head-tail connector protein [Microvirga terricola]|uniref:Phage gp6-like head-tail connector protein n=1 Tax=Microvirga terricola TaxID=2719797 RepID=A0ABX0VCL1_9HYPH|nr:head-tail connector protein [Microvirga terricola]NIX76894.1 hypothetical protein [Microvirga terricola]
MHPILIDGPAVEPVTLTEMKAYLRVDDDAEDELIAGLIKASRLMVEAAARRILIAQGWRLMLDRWPEGRTVPLPLSPVLSIESVRVFDAAGTASEVSAEVIDADLFADPPRLTATAAPERAANGIIIDLRAGYGVASDDVPDPLRLAIKILVARWFENRGDVAGDQTLPAEALALIAPFQRPRL